MLDPETAKLFWEFYGKVFTSIEEADYEVEELARLAEQLAQRTRGEGYE